MKKTLITALTLAALTAYSANAEVKVTWQNPEEYRDIDAAEESQKKFESRVFKALEEHLAKLAQELPQDQKLEITVTDLDLAGQVLPGYVSGLNSPSDTRVIKSIDFPRISFDYQLTDASGAVIQSDSVEIKDMNFQDKLHTRKIASDSLGYEKRMLKEWFDKTFSQRVATQ